MKVFNKNKREMWVSNNRVLVGGSKKVTGRNPNFDTDETRLLISIWGDPKVQKTLITTHKKHAVIARLADKMRDYGYQRSAEEINTRIKNLKCFYNRIKKEMETGSNNEPTWKHFTAMDEIMTRPIFSVRPNEIPKPSLRYKLEEAKREREERGETLDEIEEAELMKTLQGSGGGSGNVNDSNGNRSANETANNRSLDDNSNLNMGNDSEMDDDDNDTSHEDDTNLYDDDMDYEPTQPIINHNNNEEKSTTSIRLTRSRRNDKNKKNDESKNNNDFQNINQNSIDIEETSIIKDEPIDVDDDSNDEKQGNEDNGSDSYPLADYIKSGTTTSLSLHKNRIITTVAASISSSPSPGPSTSSPLKIGQATSLAGLASTKQSSNTTTISSNTQAKISLVPTNFLLKPQSQNIQQDIQQQKQVNQQQTTQTVKANSLQGLQINRQIPIRPKPSQPHIIYTHQGTGSQSTSNGIVNTSNGPMKVLLVNTLQKNTQNVPNMVKPTATIIQNKSVDLQNNNLYQSSKSTLQSNLSNINNLPQTNSVNLNGLVSSTSGEKINLIGSPQTSGKNAIGYRALLGQLIRTQDESNQLNRERLQLERERFEYEKSVGERFLNFLPGIIPNILSVFQQQQQQQHQQQQLQHQQQLQNAMIAEQTISTPSLFVTPIVSAVESSNSKKTTTNIQTDQNSEKVDDTPIVLLTPKTEKEDE